MVQRLGLLVRPLSIGTETFLSWSETSEINEEAIAVTGAILSVIKNAIESQFQELVGK